MLFFSNGPLTCEEKTTQKLAAIDLLNRRGDEFRATEVLERLPNDWSLSALAPALMKMTKASTHRVSKDFLTRLNQYFVSKIVLTYGEKTLY